MKRLLTLAAAAALTVPALTVSAQVPVGKSTAKTPILTREELRACMKREAEVEAARTAVEKRQAELDAERAQITALTDGLKPLKAEHEAAQARIREANDKRKALGARIAAFNTKAATPPADAAAREALQAEQKALNDEAAVLDREGGPIEAQYRAAVDALNAKAQVHDQRAEAWNSRRTALADEAAAVDTQRKGWAADCADRRYREDDEKAIKAGK